MQSELKRGLKPAKLAMAVCLATPWATPVLAQDHILLEEIVVTAQRREQSSQDVPIALNAFNEGFLRTTGVQSLADVQQFTPGLEVGQDSVTQADISIRGIGQSDFGIGTDPAVGVYIDGVYVGRSGSSLMQFTDLERIEVLKGPQGTLFGRNTASGAIQQITNKPVNEVQALARVRYGNYNRQLAEAMFNTPVVKDKLYLRLNGLYSKRDGFIDNALDGDDLGNERYKNWRASMLWDITEDTTLRYTYDFNNLDQQGPHAIGIAGLSKLLSPGRGDPFGEVANDVKRSREMRKLRAHTLDFTQQFEWGSMTWINSYRDFETSNREDEDGIAISALYLDTENKENNDQFYSELRFNGEGDSISWVAGLNYFHENGYQSSSVNTLGATVNQLIPAGLPDNIPWNEAIDNKSNTTSIAVFADVTWSVTDKLDLIVGLRHTRDKKEFSWFNRSNSLTGQPLDDFIFPVYADPTNPGAPGNPINIPLSQKNTWVDSDNSWNNTSPRFVAKYSWTDQVMTFFSYAKGYKAGGFNALQIDSNFDPEFVDNVELGLKSQWFDNRLRVNGSVYHYKYKDKQDVAQEPVGDFLQYVTRTGDAKGTGAEFELTWIPVSSLQLGLNYGYLRAEWTDRTSTSTTYDFTDLGNFATSVPVDMSGEPLGVPRQRAVFLVDYDLNMGQAGSLLFHLDHSYTSAVPITPASTDYDIDYPTRGSSKQFTNARITWTDTKNNWQVALWGENILNNEYTIGLNPISAPTLGTPYVRRDKPRYYGVELIYTY